MQSIQQNADVKDCYYTAKFRQALQKSNRIVLIGDFVLLNKEVDGHVCIVKLDIHFIIVWSQVLKSLDLGRVTRVQFKDACIVVKFY